jgi:uncharacterized protein (DUF3084 family)
VDKTTDKDTLIEVLLQERDELYQELSRFRQVDGGELERYEALVREKDNKISHLDEKVKNFEDKLRQLTDQLAWYRRKFWKASSEKFIPQDPSQRRIDFDGLDVLPQEEETI